MSRILSREEAQHIKFLRQNTKELSGYYVLDQLVESHETLRSMVDKVTALPDTRPGACTECGANMVAVKWDCQKCDSYLRQGMDVMAEEYKTLRSENERLRGALGRIKGLTDNTYDPNFKPRCERDGTNDYHDCFCECVYRECYDLARQALQPEEK